MASNLQHQKDNSNLFLGALVAIIALVGLFLFVFNQNSSSKTTTADDFTGEAKKPIFNPYLKATSCNADENCEMNAATIGSLKITPTRTGPQISGSSYETLTISSLLGVEIGAPIVQITGALKTGETVTNGLTVNKAAKFAGSVNFDGIRYEKSLGGLRNTFACIDPQGNLFRSDAPCDQVAATLPIQPTQ